MCKIINSLNTLDLKNIKSIQQKLQMPKKMKLKLEKALNPSCITIAE